MTPATSQEDETCQKPPQRLDLSTIRAARARLRGAIAETPVEFARAASVTSGARVWIKHDHLQVTGSFKERGAANALMQLSIAERARGVVAASAGNHALGLAHHGARLGVPVTLVMPRTAAHVKIERCRSLGANVVLAGATFDQADAYARTTAAETGLHYIHPFDDPAVMAGQGTLGLELLERLPGLDVLVLPVGGGGLLAGVAVAVKALKPDVRVIAVEPEAAASYSAAWAGGAVMRVSVAHTLADGLAVARVGACAFAASRGLVDDVVRVSEGEIAAAILHLFEHGRTIAEGAGAVALAAVLAGKIDGLRDRTVGLPVCGSNIDPRNFAHALQVALDARRSGVEAVTAA